MFLVDGEWSSAPEGAGVSIPSMYFCESKLSVWLNVGDQVVEACRTTHTLVGRYFDARRRDLTSQLVGRYDLPFTFHAELCLGTLKMWDQKMPD